tara:strand:- start:2361 stop:3380 length:1020 start_codon:yes stop_codon:yes gene_type:complete
MILIDATYIHSHGGASILQALINRLNQIESSNRKKINFLLDDRLDLNQLNGINSFEIQKIKASHFNRKKAYKAIYNKIEKVVCLSNVPPPVRINKQVYIYFHNLLLLKRKIIFSSFLFFFTSSLKFLYIRFYNSNRYNWVVQTMYMKEELRNKLKVNPSMIMVLPFYEVEDIHFQHKDFNKNRLSFFCVTSNSKHKNLKKVIKSFLKSDFTEKEKVTLLITTDGENIIYENKNIKYVGYLSRNETIKTYSKSEYVIFPSLVESFGLPIIEGIKSGSNVLISNIKSLKEICKPSIVFDPLDEKDIIKAFKTASDMSYQQNSMITIKNEINTFIKLIINDV